MIISFTNVIGAIRSLGEAAQVITTNLKMWLGFETSETLGRELNDLTWVDNGGWSIDDDIASNDGSGSTLTNAILQVGNTYEFKCKLSSYTSGDFRLMLGSSTISTNFSSTDEFTFIGVCTGDGAARVQSLSGIGSLSISSLSIKELTQITPDKSGNNNVGELFTGKALEFDGSTDYVDVDGFQMAGTNATFAFWFNSNDTLGRFFDIITGFNNRFILSFNNNQISILDDTVSWFNFGSVTTNVWNRCVITINGTTAKCFVNGVQLGTDKTISTIDFSSSTDAAIGSMVFGTQSYFDGSLSDFQIYNSAWTSDDIAYDYANPQNLVTDRSGTSIGLSNLKGYWALSEGDGLVAYDSSGEGNNGTINGATYELVQPRIPQLGMQNWSKGSNLLTYSEDFSQSVWTKNNLTQIYGFTSPTGLLNATKLIRTSTNSYIESTINITTVQYNTASIYVKGVSSTIGEDVRLYVYNGSGVSSQSFTLTGDWQRITHTNSSASGQSSIKIKLSVPNVTNGEVLVWGAQLEESSSSSSYRLTDGEATLNSTVIANPSIPTQDIFGNAVRDRLNSFNLDGSGYAEVADADDLDFGTGAFTMESWVKADFLFQGSSINVALNLGGDTAGAGTAGIVSFSSNKLGGYVNAAVLEADSTFTQGNWYHVAITRNISGLCTLYIDSVAQTDTENAGGSVTNSNTKQIGRDTNLTRFYQNLISDVRLYDAELSSDEVENNYNAGLSAHTN